ncbi:MAG TPA: laccase domain-containing protein, partial [Terriglobia bacterium]|nr:laccase domain-containing protein [Terriglobia bacterium]
FLSTAPPGHASRKGSHFGLDLVAVVKSQLKSAGVPHTRIQVADFCTSCRTDLFFSYRKEGSSTGRMMAVIGIRE